MGHKLSRMEVRAGIEGRNPKTGSEAETMEYSSLLVCFWAHIQLPAYPTEDYIPGDGTTHSEIDLPPSIATEKKCPQTQAWASLIQATSQPQFPLSILLSLHQVDKN